ncbi:MAG TPA: radical SAM protein [Firmicutes bacterium]|nr:radical SAM protein [Bacillota bacterium]
MLSAPIVVSIAITSRCNLRCLHCSASAGEGLGVPDLGREEWLEVIRELARSHVFEIVLTGGEPLMVPWWVDIVKEAVRAGMRCSLNTNALMVTEAVVSVLRDIPGLGLITVSFDGDDRDSYESLRGQGTFERAVAGIKKLVNAGLRVRLFTVVSRLNVGRLHGIVENAKELGVDSIALNCFCPVSVGKRHEAKLSLSTDEEVRAYQVVYALRETFGSFLDGSFVSRALLYKKWEERHQGERLGPPARLGCGAGWTTVSIRPDGEIVPCDMMWDAPCGHVLRDGFAKVWRSSELLGRMRSLRNMTTADIEVCRRCRVNDLCSGGCRAVAWAHGDLFGGGHGCPIAAGVY